MSTPATGATKGSLDPTLYRVTEETKNSTATTINGVHKSQTEGTDQTPSQKTNWGYYPSRMLTAVIGEGIIRKANLTNVLSLKGLDNWTSFSLSKYIPFSKEAIVQNITSTPNSDAADGVLKQTASLLKANREWMVLTGSVAGVAATINHLTANRIKNPIGRAAVSLAGGSVVVWGVSKLIGRTLGLNEALDTSLHLGVTYVVAKYAPPVLRSLGSATRFFLNEASKKMENNVNYYPKNEKLKTL